MSRPTVTETDLTRYPRVQPNITDTTKIVHSSTDRQPARPFSEAQGSTTVDYK